jgi:hypothetical protein
MSLRDLYQTPGKTSGRTIEVWRRTAMSEARHDRAKAELSWLARLSQFKQIGSGKPQCGSISSQAGKRDKTRRQRHA